VEIFLIALSTRLLFVSQSFEKKEKLTRETTVQVWEFARAQEKLFTTLARLVPT
jgi:hypothetical protein